MTETEQLRLNARVPCTCGRVGTIVTVYLATNAPVEVTVDHGAGARCHVGWRDLVVLSRGQHAPVADYGAA